jgi:divalent metal cation (Fe/Co/Zn/Cd) transporter
MVYQAYAGLMDEVPEDVTKKLLATLQGEVQSGQVAGFHQVRCRRANDELWVELHLLVPGELTVLEAHERATRVERAINAAFAPERANVTSHIEPADHDRAHPRGHRLVSPLASDP